MLDLKPLNRILFLDIETTSQKESYAELTDHQKELFRKRFKKEFESTLDLKFKEFLSKKSLREQYEVMTAAEEISEAGKKKKTTKKKKVEDSSLEEILESFKLEVGTELYNTKAPIFPEFGRILCISIGAMWKNDDADDFYNIKITTFEDEDEKVLLNNFINHPKLGPVLSKIGGKFDRNQNEFWALCAHNGRVFDFPFIAKRMIINGLKLPAMFDYAHLKPWEQNHIIDTKESWSFGVYDAAVSLDTLSDLFGTASSKDDIDGSQVKDIFWVEKDLPRIARYCEKDVVALATNYLRMKSMTEEVRVYVPPTQNQQATVEKSDENTQETSV